MAVPELLIIAGCLGLNGLLSCFEVAFISAGRPQVRQLARSGNRDAGRLLRLRDNPERTLSLIQIGITLVGAISAAVGGVGADEWLSPVLERRLGLRGGFAEGVAILLVVVPLTFLNVVVGELVPKALALKRPLQISLFGARWLIRADRWLDPVVRVFESTTKLLLKIFFPRLKPERAEDSHPLETAIDSLSGDHRQYVLNLALLEGRRVGDIVLPWPQVVTVSTGKSAAEASQIMIRSGHSRIPVVEGGRVLGFVYSKELMALMASGGTDWKPILRPILRVLEDDSLLRVMQLMQARRSHIGLVYSREKRLAGIVTLEDILEEVVGEIYDEDDDGALTKLLAEGGKLKGLRLPSASPR